MLALDSDKASLVFELGGLNTRRGRETNLFSKQGFANDGLERCGNEKKLGRTNRLAAGTRYSMPEVQGLVYTSRTRGDGTKY